MDATPPSPSPLSPPAKPPSNLGLAWPRSAQVTTAFLLGLATALLAIRVLDMTRWRTRPLELEPGRPLAYMIDINQADQPQLLQVPGIGEKTANKIGAYRQEHGDLQSVEDLTQIRGIGPATVAKWRDWIKAESGTAENVDPPLAEPNKTRRPSAKKVQVQFLGANGPKARSKKEENLTAPIDVNHASFQELQRLPGIGPKMAQRIIDERAKAPFQSVADLRRVSGIGPKILERLRPHVTIAPGPANLAAAGQHSSK